MVLQSSLDFENGEPIASNLFNLYDYCRKEVIANYRKNTSEGIVSSILVLEDILDAWKQIN
jgi:flagellar protein FliS